MAGALIPILLRRRHLRRNRIFRDRTNPLDGYDDVKLYMAFRFRRQDILSIIDDVAEQLEKANRLGSLTPSMQVLVALRFYACGSFQIVCGDLFGISQPTASRVITKVTVALKSIVSNWIQFPDQQEADRHKLQFQRMCNMPNVFGCIDGTLIPIQAPPEYEHEYVCRKNYHALNVQVICNADLMFIDIDARWPGSVHDARVLRESALFEAFESYPKPVTGILLGDSGYMLRDWLLTPIQNPATQREEHFNDAHRITRTTVERALGVAKRRWACLNHLRVKPVKACEIITVCFMLSNRARSLNLPDIETDADEPNNNDCDETEENTRNANIADPSNERTKVAAGRVVRDRIVNQFF